MRQEPRPHGSTAERAKEQQWMQALAALDQITDRFEMPIDDGIKETVAGLHLLGYPTGGSCEGHLNKAPYPWINVVAEDEPAYRWENEESIRRDIMEELHIRSEELDRSSPSYSEEQEDRLDDTFLNRLPDDIRETPDYTAWSQRNIELSDRIQRLIEKFYAGAEHEPDSPRIIAQSSVFGPRLLVDDYARESDRTLAKLIREGAPLDDGLATRLRQRQEVMKEFAAFLKREFLAAST